MKRSRSSNIELLRILAMFGVIILHYNNPNIGKALSYVEACSPCFYYLYFLQSLFACAVDLFILISGYFLINSKIRNLWKPIHLIIQVVAFKLVVYLLSVYAGSNLFTIKSLLAALIPANYFVILYCTIYLISPFINYCMLRLNKDDARRLVLFSVLLFSVWPTAVDVLSEITGRSINGLSTVGMYGSQWGYTVVNFALMYIIGAYLRLYRNSDTPSRTQLIFKIFIIVVLLIIWARFNDYTGYFTERSAWEYCNPLLILESSYIFRFFLSLDIGINRIINKLAESCFTVFLAHSTILRHIHIQEYASKGILILSAHMLFSVLLIFLMCWIIHVIYHAVIDPVLRLVAKWIEVPNFELEDT